MIKYYRRINRNNGNEQLWKLLEHFKEQNVTDANGSVIYRILIYNKYAIS